LIESFPVLSKIKIAQYVKRHLSYTYTTVLSKILSYKRDSTSSTDAFVAATRPATAVVSVSLDSPYGHPHPSVIQRWRAAGAQVLTTGERGMITVSTDGEDLRIETFVGGNMAGWR
jgi:beta-lactamase superfamily II metal-dependent hydrolase